MVLEHLADNHPLQQDDPLLNEAAAQMVIALNRKAINMNYYANHGGRRVEYSVPPGWRQENSFELADTSFEIGKFVRDSVPDGKPVKAMRMFLDGKLNLELPEFKENSFYTEKFKIKNGDELTGRDILQHIRLTKSETQQWR